MVVVHRIRWREVTRPLRVEFATSQGRKSTMMSIIVRVTLSDGSEGFGECPTSLSFRHETGLSIASTLKQICPSLLRAPVEDSESILNTVRSRYPCIHAAISGLEMALFRARLGINGVTERAHWGNRLTVIPTDITVPFLRDQTLLSRWLGYCCRRGFTTYKLKVSGEVEQDRKFISFVHETLRGALERFTLRLDGNEGYSAKTFCHITDFLHTKGFPVEFFEQPLARSDFPGFKEIRKYTPFPIVLDEAVTSGADARRAADEGLGDGINVKLAKSGVSESLSIIHVARRHGLKLMIGCMTETMVGLSAAIYLAAGTGIFDYVDLDSVFFLHGRNRWGDIFLKGPAFHLDS